MKIDLRGVKIHLKEIGFSFIYDCSESDDGEHCVGLGETFRVGTEIWMEILSTSTF
jgi:hypothetical protein